MLRPDDDGWRQWEDDGGIMGFVEGLELEGVRVWEV